MPAAVGAVVRARSGFGGDEPAALWRLALTGGEAWEVAWLAELRAARGSFDEAVVLFRAVRELEPGAEFYAFQLEKALAGAGRCDEARAELEVVTRGETEEWATELVGEAGEVVVGSQAAEAAGTEP